MIANLIEVYVQQVQQVFPDSPDNTTLAPSSHHSNSGSTTSGCSSGTDVGGESPEPTTSSSQYTRPPLPRDLQYNCLLPPPSPPIPVVAVDFEGKISVTNAGQYGGCPNESSFPIFEHRPSTMSSVSSGRNSSFDDGDMIPLPLADILIVTHGGLIRELIRYFVNTLGCQIPGGQGYTQNVSPNTGISKFTVTLGESENEPPRLTCQTIHDGDHLQGRYGVQRQAISLYSADDAPL